MIIAVIALVAGCGARKKDVQQSSRELDLAALSDTTTHVVENKAVEEKNEERSATETNKAAAGVEVGPGGSATITEFDEDGNKIRETTINENGRTTNTNEQSKSESASSSHKNETSGKVTDASGSHRLEVKDKEKTKDVQVKRDGSAAGWIWLIILLAAATYVYYRIRKNKSHESDKDLTT